MQTGLVEHVKVGYRLVGKGGNLLVEGKMIFKKDLELLGELREGWWRCLALMVEVTNGCSSSGVMCLREGRKARVFTSLPSPGNCWVGPCAHCWR